MHTYSVLSENGDKSIKALIAAKAPLPQGTEIFTSASRWELLSEVARESANKFPNILSDTDPFWIHGWRDLHGSLRIPEGVVLELSPS